MSVGYSAQDGVTVTLPAAADLSSSQWYAVKEDSNERAALCTSAGERPLGVLLNDPAALGRSASVQVSGIAQAYAGAAISVHDPIQVNASSQFITATAATDYVIGIALEAASQAGDRFALLITHAGELGSLADDALADSQMWVGNGSGVAQARTLTGDVTISNSGVTTAANFTLGGDAQGDLYFKSDATTTSRLAVGSGGDFLQVNAGATAPQWATASGDGVFADGGAFTAKHAVKWPFRIAESMTVDSDAYNGSLVFGNAADLTLTEATAAFSVVYDSANTDYQQLATSSSGAGYTGNYQHVPDTVADNDAWYMGGAVPFPAVYIDVGTAVSYTGDAYTWEYWNGAWVALTIIYDHTGNATTTGTRPFQQDGSISWKVPSDWTTTTVNGQSAYWVRARVSTSANHVGENGATNSVEHKLVAPTDGFKVPHTATITDIRVADEAATVHAANAFKFYLVDFTTGATSGELTFAISQRYDATASLTMSVSAGDNLGIVVSQEDGTNEPGPMTIEIGATLT